MKKLLSIITVLVLSVVLSVQAFAVTGFVGSATAEQAPTIVESEKTEEEKADGESLSVVPVAGVDTSSLTEEQKQELKDVFDAIENGTMTFEEIISELTSVLGDNFAVKDLFYLAGELGKDGTAEVTLKTGFGADDNFVVAMLVNGKWEIIKDFINNGDGTITLLLDKLGVVAFFVEGEEPAATETTEPTATEEPTTAEPTETEPTSGFPVGPVVIGAGIIALILFLLFKRKKDDEEEKAN